MQKLKIKILLNEKSGRIVFAYVSEHCVTFGTTIVCLFCVVGVCMSLTRTGPEILKLVEYQHILDIKVISTFKF